MHRREQRSERLGLAVNPIVDSPSPTGVMAIALLLFSNARKKLHPNFYALFEAKKPLKLIE